MKEFPAIIKRLYLSLCTVALVFFGYSIFIELKGFAGKAHLAQGDYEFVQEKQLEFAQTGLIGGREVFTSDGKPCFLKTSIPNYKTMGSQPCFVASNFEPGNLPVAYIMDILVFIGIALGMYLGLVWVRWIATSKLVWRI